MNTSPKVTPTNTSLREEIERILAILRAGSDPDTKQPHITWSDALDNIEALLTARTTEAREQAWQAGYNQGVVDGKHSMTGEHNPDTDTEQLQQLDKGEADD